MSLVSQWVESGHLKSIIRHLSSPIFLYVALYILASYLASETLYNLTTDEIIARFADIRAALSVHFARGALKMGGDDTFTQLRDVVLEFMVSDPMKLGKDMLERVGDAGFVGLWDHRLMIMLTQKVNGKGYLFVVPAMETRCRLHVHRHTQTC